MVGKKHESNSDGFVLVTVLLLLSLFTGMGLASLAGIQSTIKSSGLLRMDTMRYYQADGGALSVFGYMTAFKRTDVPAEVKHTADFDVNVKVFGQSVRYPAGFSTLWKGADVEATSTSKDGFALIQSIAFIPTSPAGYGNE
jgi:hypothetical protein